MQGLAPRKYPRQACSLDCIAKLRFAFQPAPAGKTVTPYISLQPATVFRPQPADTFPADFLQSTTLSGPNYLTPGASRPTTFRRISFHTSPHNLPLARNLHSGLTGQYIPSLILSLFFFHSTPCQKNRGQPAKPILLYFSYNSKSSPNLVQASLSQSLSLLFSPSNQYTLLHKPRSCHT